MGFYTLDLDGLARHTGKPIEELKKKAYAELEQIESDMKREKYLGQNAANAADDGFARLVKKFFQPAPLLRHWFDDNEIVFACADSGITERTLCDEQFTEPGRRLCHEPSEYKETTRRMVPQYDSKGRELLERADRTVDVYRVPGRYQSTCHGIVVLRLLYGRYPALEQFGFNAYGMSPGEKGYELYPKNHLYVPMAALMSGDVDAILFRNMEYCESYNCGEYTLEKHAARVLQDDVQDMLHVIVAVGRAERALGHSPISVGADGRHRHVSGMEESVCTEDGSAVLLCMPDKEHGRRSTRRPFRIYAASPMTVGGAIKAALDMLRVFEIRVRVMDGDDILGEHAVACTARRTGYIPPDHGTWCLPAASIFGWREGDAAELAIRTAPVPEEEA